jgi:hypothetical protein
MENVVVLSLVKFCRVLIGSSVVEDNDSCNLVHNEVVHNVGLLGWRSYYLASMVKFGW